jgi:hypothetical protein
MINLTDTFDVGDRVRLAADMQNDPAPLPAGATGTITRVFVGGDAFVQYHIQWDPPHQRRTLMAVCPPDQLQKLLPWPGDSIMMVCSSPQNANRAAMESVNQGWCRVCTAEIVYDGRSMRRALEIAAKTGGRPVQFFCEECAKHHDLFQCNRLIDHSGGKSVEVFDEKGRNL